MSNQTSLENVQIQLDKLERDNRRLRLGMLALVAATSIVALTGWQDKQEELTLKKLTLSDGKGNTSHLDATSHVFLKGEKPVMVVNNDDGEPGVVFFDSAAKARLVLGTSPTGAVLSFLDADGINRILMTQQGAEAALKFEAPGSKEGLYIAATSSGSLLYFEDANEKTRLSLGITPGNPAAITLSDTKGQTRASLQVDDTEQQLAFFDAAGKALKTYGPGGAR